MMNIVTIISTEIKNKIRQIKCLRFGKSDVQVVAEAAPYGTDSNPIKDMVAVYLSSDNMGNKVIVGYMNKNQLAAPGELRHFSTDSTGALKAYTWLKADGTYEILGNDDFMVSFTELKKGFDDLKKDFNDFVTQKYDLHIHSGGTISGSTGPGNLLGSPSTASVDNSKLVNVKTKKP